ncbi:uncharacterized protein EKO05_0009001 [Ascochyta rabiei]|uniref:uncharacterized protein n=1 Tax=Didymella rabiei TaxID=5454 RepID=UPI0021FBC30A|nr:uncharacterized protein EKO05_0009001 [Ascochyta rabiei]UPX18709.1 hypothetical protein EKO05_0009001 [Ascochyta rabiei]
MSSKRKRTYNTDSIPISSSSSSSQASEDSVLESDEESPSRRRGCAAANDMSQRQTRKINSGRFGMFNSPTLMRRLLGSSNLEKKRRRTNKCSKYRRGSSSQPIEPELLVADNDEDEDEDEDKDKDEDKDEQSLFVPDIASQSQPVTIDDGNESDGESLYEDLTPERARKVKEYIHILNTIETAGISLQTAADELSTAVAEHTTVPQKLKDMHITVDNRVAEIMQERDEAIRIANERAEQKIQRVRERLPRERGSYEERMKECVGRKSTAEKSIAKLETEVLRAREQKDEMERLGGFELCSDTRKVQAKKVGR